MKYETPTVMDHGSIAEHTFTRAGGGSNDPDMCQGAANPPKDWRECKLDCFGEYSCPSS